MVSLRALVDRWGLVLPSRNWPHSGCPLLAHPFGSWESARRSLNPIGACGQPSASAMGRGMAMVSGVLWSDLASSGAIAGWLLACRASLRTPPHALPAGDQITGWGPLA